jgi:guanyl-specific ribonuclease Sa
MYRRRQERRKRILQKIIRWHPVILLLIMFVLGACTRGKTNSYTITAASAAEASAAETVAMAQENFAEFERIDDSLAENPAYASAAQVQIVAFTEPAQVPSREAAAQDSEEETEETLPEKTLPEESTDGNVTVWRNGNYSSREEVALYVHAYGTLPSNYITKRKAEERGWDSRRGNLSDVLPGMSIGGSEFGNYEGRLPAEKGRKYYECDIDYNGGSRNTKRIIYSSDGLVYYTEDQYQTFAKLY